MANVRRRRKMSNKSCTTTDEFWPVCCYFEGGLQRERERERLLLRHGLECWSNAVFHFNPRRQYCPVDPFKPCRCFDSQKRHTDPPFPYQHTQFHKNTSSSLVSPERSHYQPVSSSFDCYILAECKKKEFVYFHLWLFGALRGKDISIFFQKRRRDDIRLERIINGQLWRHLNEQGKWCALVMRTRIPTTYIQ